MEPTDARLLASAPGHYRAMGPMPPPPYMQALDKGMSSQVEPVTPSTSYQAALEQPAASTMATAAAPAGKARVAPVGQMINMAGYDNANWADADMDSVKYAHGRLANGITKPSDMARLVASEAYQARFPGATFDGKDRINFNGALSDGVRGGSPVGSVDVLVAADRDLDSAREGAWMPLEEGGPAAAGDPNGELERRRIAEALGLTQRPTNNINIQDIIAQLMAEQQAAR